MDYILPSPSLALLCIPKEQIDLEAETRAEFERQLEETGDAETKERLEENLAYSGA